MELSQKPSMLAAHGNPVKNLKRADAWVPLSLMPIEAVCGVALKTRLLKAPLQPESRATDSDLLYVAASR